MLVFFMALNVRIQSPVDTVDSDEKGSGEDLRKKYNVNILKEVQAIFGHLACSKLQYYVPKGLWRNFRYLCRYTYSSFNFKSRLRLSNQ